MRDLGWLMAFVLGGWLVFGWATLPSAVATEHANTVAAQIQVRALETRVAQLAVYRPTPQACSGPSYFGRAC